MYGPKLLDYCERHGLGYILGYASNGKLKQRAEPMVFAAEMFFVDNAETQEIEAGVLTGNDCHDSQAVSPLLKRTRHKLRRFYGDGVYDPWEVREKLAKRKAQQIIPPRKDAIIKRHGNSKESRLERDETIRGIRKLGRKGWKRRIGYHRRSPGETAMFRMKTIYGDRLKNRLLENQKTEAGIRCKILDHFTHLGLPLHFVK